MDNIIAVQVNKDNQVTGVSTVYGDLPDGWIEVTSDPYFTLTNYSEWSVENGQLVKTTSGLTPIGENREAITNLTQVAGQTMQEMTQLTQLMGQTQEAITQLTQLVAAQNTADNSTKEDK